MALTHIPLDAVTEDELQRLITTGTAESLHIEYKRATYGTNDKARREFLADVSSFANTAGGDLLIGIDENAGVPTAIRAYKGNIDIEKNGSFEF